MYDITASSWCKEVRHGPEELGPLVVERFKVGGEYRVVELTPEQVPTGRPMVHNVVTCTMTETRFGGTAHENLDGRTKSNKNLDGQTNDTQICEKTNITP